MSRHPVHDEYDYLRGYMRQPDYRRDRSGSLGHRLAQRNLYDFHDVVEVEIDTSYAPTCRLPRDFQGDVHEFHEQQMHAERQTHRKAHHSAAKRSTKHEKRGGHPKKHSKGRSQIADPRRGLPAPGHSEAMAYRMGFVEEDGPRPVPSDWLMLNRKDSQTPLDKYGQPIQLAPQQRVQRSSSSPPRQSARSPALDRNRHSEFFAYPDVDGNHDAAYHEDERQFVEPAPNERAYVSFIGGYDPRCMPSQHRNEGRSLGYSEEYFLPRRYAGKVNVPISRHRSSSTQSHQHQHQRHSASAQIHQREGRSASTQSHKQRHREGTEIRTSSTHRSNSSERTSKPRAKSTPSQGQSTQHHTRATTRTGSIERQVNDYVAIRTANAARIAKQYAAEPIVIDRPRSTSMPLREAHPDERRIPAPSQVLYLQQEEYAHHPREDTSSFERSQYDAETQNEYEHDDDLRNQSTQDIHSHRHAHSSQHTDSAVQLPPPPRALLEGSHGMPVTRHLSRQRAASDTVDLPRPRQGSNDPRRLHHFRPQGNLSPSRQVNMQYFPSPRHQQPGNTHSYEPTNRIERSFSAPHESTRVDTRYHEEHDIGQGLTVRTAPNIRADLASPETQLKRDDAEPTYQHEIVSPLSLAERTQFPVPTIDTGRQGSSSPLSFSGRAAFGESNLGVPQPNSNERWVGSEDEPVVSEIARPYNPELTRSYYENEPLSPSSPLSVASRVSSPGVGDEPYAIPAPDYLGPLQAATGALEQRVVLEVDPNSSERPQSGLFLSKSPPKIPRQKKETTTGTTKNETASNTAEGRSKDERYGCETQQKSSFQDERSSEEEEEKEQHESASDHEHDEETLPKYRREVSRSAERNLVGRPH